MKIDKKTDTLIVLKEPNLLAIIAGIIFIFGGTRIRGGGLVFPAKVIIGILGCVVSWISD